VETFGRLRSTYHRLTIAYLPRPIDLETNLSVFVKEHEMFWSSGPAFTVSGQILGIRRAIAWIKTCLFRRHHRTTPYWIHDRGVYTAF
jgi:hypothetical protein